MKLRNREEGEEKAQEKKMKIKGGSRTRGTGLMEMKEKIARQESPRRRGGGMPSDPSFSLFSKRLSFLFLPKGRKVRNPSRFELGLDFLPSVYLSLSVHPLSVERRGQKEQESSIDFDRMKVHIPFH